MSSVTDRCPMVLPDEKYPLQSEVISDYLLREFGIRESHPIAPKGRQKMTIYSNSTLLGNITIGHDTVIGGNVWVTNSVPPHSKILQIKAQDVSFIDGGGI